MSGRINAFRSAVIADFNSKLTGQLKPRSIEPQFGRFNLEELDRFSIKTPAIRVAVLTGDVPTVPSGEVEAELKCAAFVITEGNLREELGWMLGEAIATRMHSGQLWGIVRLSAPSKVAIRPIVSASLKDRGVAIIAVEWTQTLRGLGEGIFDQAGEVITGIEINGVPLELPTAEDGDEQP